MKRKFHFYTQMCLVYCRPIHMYVALPLQLALFKSADANWHFDMHAHKHSLHVKMAWPVERRMCYRWMTNDDWWLVVSTENLCWCIGNIMPFDCYWVIWNTSDCILVELHTDVHSMLDVCMHNPVRSIYAATEPHFDLRYISNFQLTVMADHWW